MSDNPTNQSAESRRFLWLLLCFTCSGISSLIYEVAWVRSLDLIFGATTFAVATVLAAFMGGLAFGSFMMGRIADRLQQYHPLRIYALMECGIGVVALIIPFVFEALIPLYQAIWKQFHASFALFSAIRFVLCIVILLIPTSLMGATLPIMSLFVNRNANTATGQKRIGLLYAVNAVGAVLGCMAAGFLLFPLVGLSCTQWIAVALSSTAALGAFLLSKTQPWKRTEDSLEPQGSAEAAAVSANALKTGAGLLVFAYAVSGFTAMLYEVAWTRVLVLVLGSSTYAYTTMLGTFLSGLAIGAWFAARYLQRHGHALLMVALCQVFTGLTTYVGILLVEELPYLYVRMIGTANPGAFEILGIQFLFSAGLMILPTLGMGAMFPLVINGLCPTGNKTARIVGWAYSLNTIGAIGGSVIAGFWLLPKLGMQTTLIVGIALNALMSAACFSKVRSGPAARFRWLAGGAALLFALNLFYSVQTWPPEIMSSGVFRYFRGYLNLTRAQFLDRVRQTRGAVLMFKEGLTCTVTIYQTVRALVLLVNGKPDASTPPNLAPVPHPAQEPSLNDLPTQILLGQVPLLCAPKMDDIMVIGLGSGVTVGSVLRNPIKSVECVELEAAVVEGSVFFSRFNGRPQSDPRFKLVVNDARNHLLVTDRKYDVIISEPSNPWIPGAATLFTCEFFDLAKTKMNPQGVFCQWIQLYELHRDDFFTILRSFQKSFPHMHLFRVGMDAILLGTTSPLGMEPSQISSRMIPGVAQDLALINIKNLDDFLAYYWTGGEEIKGAIAQGPVNTDDNMFIEFRAPLRVMAPGSSHGLNAGPFFSKGVTGLLKQLPSGNRSPEAESTRWAELARGAFGQGMNDLAYAYASNSLQLRSNGLAARIAGEAMFAMQQYDKVSNWWHGACATYPSDTNVLAGAIAYHASQQNWNAARQMAETFVKTAPDSWFARYHLGQSLGKLGYWADALTALDPLTQNYDQQKQWKDLAFLIGQAFWHNQRFAEAAPPLRKAIEANPSHAEANALLADIFVRTGKPDEAARQWQRVAQLTNSRSLALLGETQSARQNRDYRQALEKANEAYALNPWNEDIVFEYARAQSRNGQVQEAINAVEKYLSWDKDRAWAVGLLGHLYEKSGNQQKSLDLQARYHALTGQAWRQIED